MDNKLKIGVVCLARKTFDYEAAAQIYEKIRADLNLIEDVEFHCTPELLFEPEDAGRAAEELQRFGADALVAISGTFHLGNLLLEITKKLNHPPLLLWGLNELPYDSGKIRLNTVCGVNLDASNLYKAGIRNYYAVFGPEIDRDWLAAMQAIATLKNARIGLIGSRAHTFYNVAFDELDTWRELGLLVDQYSLQELLDYPAGADAERNWLSMLGHNFKQDDINEQQALLTARLAAKLDGFMADRNLTSLALRCWPEFAASYGIAPCGSLSLVQSKGRIIACEGDVEGAISMLIHRALGAETPFLADLSQVNFEKDEALLWHCGVAPCNLWDGRCEISLDSYHAGGRGVTAGFVLKEGALSLLRLDSAGRERRLFSREGLSLPMEKELKGTYARVKFDGGVKALLEQVIYNGIAHHVSVAYGSYRRPLEIMARIKNWDLIS
jgi:L-fucose isomerase-like protein